MNYDYLLNTVTFSMSLYYLRAIHILNVVC
jgi:hypothetical protein